MGVSVQGFRLWGLVFGSFKGFVTSRFSGYVNFEALEPLACVNLRIVDPNPYQ